jgi:hypothetical protein
MLSSLIGIAYRVGGGYFDDLIAVPQESTLTMRSLVYCPQQWSPTSSSHAAPLPLAPQDLALWSPRIYMANILDKNSRL